MRRNSLMPPNVDHAAFDLVHWVGAAEAYALGAASLTGSAALTEAQQRVFRPADELGIDAHAAMLGALAPVLDVPPVLEIALPKPVNESETLLRIDLRDFKWTFDSWGRVQSAYSYGWRGRGWKPISDLSGAELPYIRADWFVARVSCPPLYHDALDLPNTVQELERRLGVDTARNLREEKACFRAGVRASGVSRNNRVIERHETAFGAYWKSYDFATSSGEQNIFTNPLRRRPDGGGGGS